MSEPAYAEETAESPSTGDAFPHPTSGRRPGAGADPETTLKGLAKSMARDATAQISDRHLRARVRTTCYNQTVNVLRQLDRRLAAQRLRHRRTSMILCGIIAALSLALAVSVAI